MASLDVSEVLDDMITGTYSVSRAAVGSYTAGIHSPGSASTFMVDAVVQPAGGRDLQRLPEGVRSSEVRAIWTRGDLRTASASYLPDRITIDGAVYEVQKVLDRAPDGAYCKVLAVREG